MLLWTTVQPGFQWLLACFIYGYLLGAFEEFLRQLFWQHIAPSKDPLSGTIKVDQNLFFCGE
jgi:hypothetical protein